MIPILVESALAEGSGSDSEALSDSQDPVDSSRLTARQRALVTRGGTDVEDRNAPLADERPSKRKIFSAEETALRKSETARRRKHQADAKAEEAKIQTIQKLVQKQSMKKKARNEGQVEDEATEFQGIRYINRVGGSTLHIPENKMHLYANVFGHPTVMQPASNVE
ncbi:hypothetical protein DFS34DRAFT_595353 [Phlyctochytrium arcticum]|nr:hypothetical protein DFS34DRAFT_595353 [Phlyctochytrium arcticum]